MSAEGSIANQHGVALQTQNRKPIAVAGVWRLSRVLMVIQRYVFHQNPVGLGRGDGLAGYPSGRGAVVGSFMGSSCNNLLLMESRPFLKFIDEGR